MGKKIAIVTGGASGIGKAISIGLAKTGIIVVILARNEERGKSVAKLIVENSGEAYYHKMDLANPEEIECSMREILEKYGHIDILVNNAAISGFMGPVVNTPINELKNTLQINLTSAFHLSKLVLPGMIENNFGRIINISSVAPRLTPPNSATYNISKAGLNALTRTLSREVATYGVTINAVAPGLVLTERIMKSRLPDIAKRTGKSTEEVLAKMVADTDTKRLTKEEDVAELVMFLVSDAAQNITGEIVNIAGGY